MIQETRVDISSNALVASYKTDQSLDENIQSAPFRSLFRFADTIDKVLMVLGAICAIGNGVALPFFAYPYGRLTQAFAPDTPTDFIINEVKQAYITFLINSVVIFLLSWFMFSSWMITSERQSIKCRKQYFAALLRQEIGWYDRCRVEEIASNAYLYATNLQNAIGEKVSKIFMTAAMGTAGFVIAYITGWKLAIVVTAVIPFLLVAGYFNNHYLKQATDFISMVNSKAQGMAEEVLMAIKTVKTLAGERYQVENFSRQITQSTTKAINYGFIRSVMSSMFFFSIIMTYTIGFWYGSVLVSKSEINDNSKQTYNVSDVIIIFFCIYMSGLNLGQVPESIKNFAIGRKSAARMFSVIDRKPKIESGLFYPLKEIKSIVFQDVEFFYQTPLFKNFSLEIKPGKVAFVGGSGCGKSTLLSLLMRYYDPFHGKIAMRNSENELNWKDLDLAQLRTEIGYVGQEPVLIGSTIREAVSGNNYEEEDVVRALKLAEAWGFVQDIGLDSSFGSLSGGQKQRIAIARALIKKPKILILDEATSALDRKNEKEIQSTLDKLKVQFMIVVAHKIETIKSSDSIFVLEKGRLVEKGTYESLMMEKGLFYELAKGQELADAEEMVYEDEMGEEKMESSMVMESQIRRKSMESNLEKNESKVQDDSKNSKEKEKEKGKEGQNGDSEEGKEEQEPASQFTFRLFFRMLTYNKKYVWLMIIGLLASIFTGTVFPLFSSFLSKIIVILSAIKYSPPEKVPSYQNQAHNLAITLFAISCTSLFTHFVKTSSFMYVAERLSFSLKYDVYKKLLRTPMAYHDGKEGKQTATILSGDCHVVNTLTSSLLSDIFQNATTLVVGLVIAFVNCWQITLVALALIPILLLAGKLQMSFAVGTSSQAEYKKSHQIVQVGVVNIKTVLAFNMQDDLKRTYSDLLEQPLKIAIKRGNISGLMYGLSQMAITCILALIFFIGSIFLQKYNMDVLSIFTAIYAIMFAAVQAGGQLQFIPNFGALKVAAVNIFKILDLEEEEYEEDPLSERTHLANVQGNMVIENLTFKYESREGNVFQKINMKIPAGKRVALVGPSGCGKSTILQLIMRLYQQSEGSILLDGKDIRELNLESYRGYLGVVSQEPVLFNRSVLSNVRYNRADIGYDEVVEACKQANAYQFVAEANFGLDDNRSDDEGEEIASPKDKVDGFRKKVGLRGGFLSGGQKQRIAIARAIARNPKLLLLDQATSALDTQNEQQVQEAIDSMSGMTTIIVAHRLSTIQKCDIIYVFDDGKIVEEGVYQELLAIKGYFFRLANGIQQKKPNLIQVQSKSKKLIKD